MKIQILTSDHLRGFDRTLTGIEDAIAQAKRVQASPHATEIDRRVAEGVIEAMELAWKTVYRHLEPMRGKGIAA